MCHRGRLGWAGTSGLRQQRGTGTHQGPYGPLMCSCDPVLPSAGGPGPAQPTPMTHISANGTHRTQSVHATTKLNAARSMPCRCGVRAMSA